MDESKLFNLMSMETIEYQAALELASQQFSWDGIITAVSLAYNATTNDPASHGNLLTNPDNVPMTLVQFNAACTWGTIDYNNMSFDNQDIVDIDSANVNYDKVKFQTCLCCKIMAPGSF